MENNELGLNVEQIAQSRYIIPLYQRNFAWEENEISQLLSDIYENFNSDRTGNYFVGSLVVFKRNGNEDFWEVIDGQQRLTVLSLIIKRLAEDKFTKPFLSYDSRDEVSEFLNTLYTEGLKAAKQKSIVDETRNLHNALDFIEDADLTAKDLDKVTRIRDLDQEELKAYTDYILHNVFLVRVEMPEDTDVANYFEIMNNRGEQLQKHEILKSQLMSRLKVEQQPRFSLIWDACSQMDRRIQRNFEPTVRESLFGSDYTELNLDAEFAINTEDDEECKIDDIIKLDKQRKESKEKGERDDEEITETSIIDFPNFLMHIFRLCYNDKYVLFTKKEGDKVPLNDKFLLDVYKKIGKQIDPMLFVKQLLYYRTIFDKYIVKSVTDDNSDNVNDEDDSRWTLSRPCRRKDKATVDFNNTIKDVQQQVVKVLSMFQVSYRTRIYKEYLSEILSWFNFDETSIEMEGMEYLKKLNDLALQYYERVKSTEWTDKNGEMRVGVAVPHYVFNFIDYLYWVAAENKVKGIANLDMVENFDFSYRNSVEHHLPQSFESVVSNQHYSYDTINCLGNLCLISKSVNSKLSNEQPVGKASKEGKYYKRGLSPKRKIMYDITNLGKRWSEAEIEEHDKNVKYLLSMREKVLSDINVTLDLSDNNVLRALMCIEDISVQSNTINGVKYCVKDENHIKSLNAYQQLLEWKKKNPTVSYEDFIKQRLDNDENLKALKSDNGNSENWIRYLLISKKELLDYMNEGCFTITKGETINEEDEDDSNNVIVMSKSRLSFVNYYKKLKYCTYFELWTGILALELQKFGILTRLFYYYESHNAELAIVFTSFGSIEENSWSIEENPVLFIDETYMYSLSVPNSIGNTIFENKGWAKCENTVCDKIENVDDLYYRDLEDIQTDTRDIITEIDSTVKNVRFLIENIQEILSKRR